MDNYSEIGLERSGFVAVIEMRRPPDNYFDAVIVGQIADALEALDKDAACRAVVLAASGRSFCAGAKLGGPPRPRTVYDEAVRLFRTQKPIVAALEGPAVGGGLGLALAADFRVICPEAWLSANFTRLGLHPGFGLTVTLPELVGRNAAQLILYTGRRVGGEQAVEMGLANVLAARAEVRTAAIALAAEIAECGPLAVSETRATLRAGLADRILAAFEVEQNKQKQLRGTADFAEGVKAQAERRPAQFSGK